MIATIANALLMLACLVGLSASAWAQEAAPEDGASGGSLIPTVLLVEPVRFEIQGEKKELTMESRDLGQVLADAGIATWGQLQRANPDSLGKKLKPVTVVLLPSAKWGRRAVPTGASEPVNLAMFHSRMPRNLAKLLIWVAGFEGRDGAVTQDSLRRAIAPRRVLKLRNKKR